MSFTSVDHIHSALLFCYNSVTTVFIYLFIILNLHLVHNSACGSFGIHGFFVASGGDIFLGLQIDVITSLADCSDGLHPKKAVSARTGVRAEWRIPILF